MKNRIYVILITLICSLMLCSCKNGGNDAIDDFFDPYSYQNTVVTIYNADSQEIGSICCYSHSVLVNSSVLYTKLPKSPSPNTKTLEFWLYDIESGEDHKLGTITDPYDGIYRASYETTVVDGHMYMSVSTGGYVERETRKQAIYDVDLETYCMTKILEVEGAIPYNSFTIVGDTLYLAELLENGATDIIKFSLAKDREKLPVVHPYNVQETFTADSIRHIRNDGTHIFMVRLHAEENGEYSPFIDTYDTDLNLVDTKDISAVCIPWEYVEVRDQSWIDNERKQWIVDFNINDKYIYYKNFSDTFFCGSVNTTGANRLLDMNDLFSIALSAEECHDDLFLKNYGGEYKDKNRRNLFYLADPQSGEIKKASFYADDARYVFCGASRNGSGKILLSMCFWRQKDGDENLPDRLYYLDMNDLDFTPI